ncbi:MAG: hypothetical protein GX593_05450 [Actinomycetales bacterium]|nr:hypothetical protein [Actinomycetales bacterium]
MSARPYSRAARRLAAITTLVALALGGSLAPAHAAEPYDGVPLTARGRYLPDETAVDSRGNVYFSATYQRADMSWSSMVLRRSTSGKVTRVAGTTTLGKTKAGRATKTRLGLVSDLALDSRGNLYIADCTNRVVSKVSPSGKLTVVAGKVGKTGRPKAGKATKSRFACPEALAVDADRNVFVLDWSAKVVTKVTPRGDLSIVAGKVGKAGSPTPGPATKSRLGNPVDIAADTAGNLYIADAGDYGYVEKVTPEGELSIIAGRGGFGRPKSGKLATRSYLGIVESIDVDAKGTVYLGMSNGLWAGNFAVVGAIGTDGVLDLVAGRLTKRGAPRAGSALKSKLDAPLHVTVRPSGSVYATFSVGFGSKGSYIVKITKKGKLSVLQRTITVR